MSVLCCACVGINFYFCRYFFVNICVDFCTLIMHTASYEFLMKPKESAGCHQTLSTRVGSGDETTLHRLPYHPVHSTQNRSHNTVHHMVTSMSGTLCLHVNRRFLMHFVYSFFVLNNRKLSFQAPQTFTCPCLPTMHL